MRVVEATEQGIAEAAAVIKSGGVVAFPTETVYGLAADPFNVAAVERVLEIKGRSISQTLPLILNGSAQLSDVVSIVPPGAKPLIERFWPGPLSLVMPARGGLPAGVVSEDMNVCVRVPGSASARALAEAAGGVITATSANRHGKPAAMSVDEVMLEDIDLVVDGGRLESLAPSTIFEPETGQIHRIGPVSLKEIALFWGAPVRLSQKASAAQAIAKE